MSVEAQIVPVQAWMVAVPGVTAYTAPKLVASFVTVAALAFDEVQIADASVCGDPSLNFPVAVSRTELPTAKLDGLDEIVIDDSPGGASVAGVNSSAADVTAPELPPVNTSPPVISTFPLPSRFWV
jgi:hypothetical protein